MEKISGTWCSPHDGFPETVEMRPSSFERHRLYCNRKTILDLFKEITVSVPIGSGAGDLACSLIYGATVTLGVSEGSTVDSHLAFFYIDTRANITISSTFIVYESGEPCMAKKNLGGANKPHTLILSFRIAVRPKDQVFSGYMRSL